MFRTKSVPPMPMMVREPEAGDERHEHARGEKAHAFSVPRLS